MLNFPLLVGPLCGIALIEFIAFVKEWFATGILFFFYIFSLCYLPTNFSHPSRKEIIPKEEACEGRTDFA
jgi:hypothetical protein